MTVQISTHTHIQGYSQQDAQEFLVELLDKIVLELARKQQQQQQQPVVPGDDRCLNQQHNHPHQQQNHPHQQQQQQRSCLSGGLATEVSKVRTTTSLRHSLVFHD